MRHGWSAEEIDLTADRREILDAVESWLVDPRPRPRMHHESSRDQWGPAPEIDLETSVISLPIDRLT